MFMIIMISILVVWTNLTASWIVKAVQKLHFQDAAAECVFKEFSGNLEKIINEKNKWISYQLRNDRLMQDEERMWALTSKSRGRVSCL